MAKAEKLKKGEATRQRIIKAAATVFNKSGLAATSMSDLMEHTGLEKGGLYRHFASKDDLACEAFKYSFATVNEFRFADLTAAGGPNAQLKAFLAHFVHQRSPIAGGCPIFNTAVEARSDYPKLKKLASDALTQWQDKLASIILAGQTCGEIDPTLDPKETALMILSCLEGALVIRNLTGHGSALLSAETFLRKLLDA